MKLTTSSLFFIILISILALQCKDADNQTTQTAPDTSLFERYYTEAKNKAQSKLDRLRFLDSAHTEATRLQADSLILKSESYKTSIYGAAKRYRQAIILADTLLSHAATLKDTSYMAKAYFKKGLYHNKLENSRNAFLNYDMAKELHILRKDSTEIAKIVLNIATLQKNQGDYRGAEATGVDGLKFLTETSSQRTELALYNLLSLTSKELTNYNEALYWNEKAIAISSKPALSLILNNNKNNILIKQGQFETAKSAIEKTLRDSIIHLQKFEKAKFRELDHYGEVLSYLNIQAAEDTLLKALQGRQRINDVTGIYSSHIHIADHQLRQGNKVAALTHAEQALQIANSIKNPDAQVEALSYIVRTKNNPKEEAIAYQYLSDSIIKAQVRLQDQFAKIRFDATTNREDNLKLRAETAEQQLALNRIENRTLFITALAIGLIAFGILFFRYLKERHKRERLHVAYQTETKISKRVHDELANDLYQVMTQIQIDGAISKTRQNTYLDALDDAYQRTRDISRETSTINTENFSEELKQMIFSYKNDAQNIVTKGLNNQILKGLSETKKITVYRVLQELMTNFKKHSKATQCSIIASKNENKLSITYTDNGIGISKNQYILKNGLQNVENRMESISGSFTFDSEKGRGLRILLSTPY